MEWKNEGSENWEQLTGDTYPKATTTPPVSLTTDRPQPGQVLFSEIREGSGRIALARLLNSTIAGEVGNDVRKRDRC